MLHPKNAEPLIHIAKNLFFLGKPKLAVEAFNEAHHHLQKPEWFIFHNLGQCYLSLGDLKKAKESFRQAIQMNRQEASFLLLAKTCTVEDDLKTAADILKTGLELFPDSVEMTVNLGLIYMDSGDHQKAFEKFGTALAYNPSCPKALLAVGAMMQGHSELDVALAKYKLALVGMPESVSLWSNMGMCFFGKRKFVAALSCLQRANYLAPFDWKILYNLGIVHLATEQYASAFHYLSAAANLDALASSVYLPLAVTLSSLGDVKNARYAFQEALTAAPADPAVVINFALFLYQQNDVSGAAHFYGKFLQLAERQSNLKAEILQLANELGKSLHLPGGKDNKTHPGEAVLSPRPLENAFSAGN